MTWTTCSSITSATDLFGNSTNLVRTSFARLPKTHGITDPLGNVTRIYYDPLNQVTSVIDPLGNTTAFTYDGNGNRLTVADANQHTTSYIYDSMDRPTQRTDPLGHSAYAQYDLNNNLTQVTDRKGNVTTLTYDGINRPKLETFADSSTVNFTFDAGNRLTQAVDSLSGTVQRTYDGRDHLLTETTPQGSVAYTYDLDERRQTMTASNQAQVNYAFDNDSRLTSITQGGAGVVFGYDADSRRTSLALPNGNTAAYSYDAASQLLGIVYQGGALGVANLSYAYDLDGRRVGVSGTLANEILPAAVSSATYNANNQLTQWGSTAMSYDLNGNTLSDGTNSYVWDARNRLVSANSGGATFSYDPLGRRVSKTLLSMATNFLYDGPNPVQEQNGSGVTANLLTGGIDERFQRTDSTGAYSYLTDALGSTMALTDSTGNSDVQYTYSPYGAMSISGSTTNSYDYTGRESDGLGLHYYRARYYNPTTGRFLSEDPAGFMGGIDKYAYVGGSPINFSDSSGLCPSSPGRGGQPPNPRTQMAQQGATKLALSTVSLAANLSVGNLYGAWGSFTGMVSADEYLIGAATGNTKTAEAAAQWVDTFGTATGAMEWGLGASPAEASNWSALENAATTAAGFSLNPTNSLEALGTDADVTSSMMDIQNFFNPENNSGGSCSQ